MGPTVVMPGSWLAASPTVPFGDQLQGTPGKAPRVQRGNERQAAVPPGLSDSPVSGTASPCWRCPCRHAVHPRPRTWSAERPW